MWLFLNHMHRQFLVQFQKQRRKISYYCCFHSFSFCTDLHNPNQNSSSLATNTCNPFCWVEFYVHFALWGGDTRIFHTHQDIQWDGIEVYRRYRRVTQRILGIRCSSELLHQIWWHCHSCKALKRYDDHMRQDKDSSSQYVECRRIYKLGHFMYFFSLITKHQKLMRRPTTASH